MDNTLLSVADFLQNQTIPNQELIQGQKVALPLIDETYQKHLKFFHDGLKSAHMGKVLGSPTAFILDGWNLVQPALAFILVGNGTCQLEKGQLWRGAPDLCVDILGENQKPCELNAKHKAYERAGVTEYWLVEPSDGQVYVYNVEHHRIHNYFDYHDRLTSFLLPQISLRLADILRNPCPLANGDVSRANIYNEASVYTTHEEWQNTLQPVAHMDSWLSRNGFSYSNEPYQN